MADEKIEKIILPVFAGLKSGAHVLVPAATNEERLAWALPATGDMLDDLVELLGRPGVKARIRAEFTAESSLIADKLNEVQILSDKKRKKGRPSKAALALGDTEVGAVTPRADVFNDKQVTYVSWTLSAVIPSIVSGYEKKDGSLLYGLDVFDPESKASNARKSDYMLLLALDAYISKVGDLSVADVTALWRKIYILVRELQRAVFDWNEETEKFDIVLADPIYRAHPHFDQSLMRGFNRFVRETRFYVEMKESGEGKRRLEILREIKTDLGVRQVELLKIANAKSALKVGTAKILLPESVSEVKFREMVREMTDVVFVGGGGWDQVVILPGETHRLMVALCLLMLGVGSRSRGIIMVNEIEALGFDVIKKEVEEKETVIEDEKQDASVVVMRRELAARTVGFGTMRVKRLTKDVDEDKQVEDAIGFSKAFGKKELTEGEARSVVDINKETKMIDKPFLYMLFTPPDGAVEYKAQEVYIQLFKTVRDCMKSLSEQEEKKDWGGSVDWETYETLGREIWVLTREQTNAKPKEMFMKWVWGKMEKVCTALLTKHLGSLTSKKPHQLRRMYVCYSYEYFGRGISKEIGYAQYVLRHTSISSSMRYTTLSFVMALSDSLAKDKDFKNEFVDAMAEVAALRAEVADMRGVKRMRESEVRFTAADDEDVVLAKLPRAKKGTPRASLIERALGVADEMEARGVRVTHVNLVKAGVNTDIVKEVLKTLRDRAVKVEE